MQSLSKEERVEAMLSTISEILMGGNGDDFEPISINIVRPQAEEWTEEPLPDTVWPGRIEGVEQIRWAMDTGVCVVTIVGLVTPVQPPTRMPTSSEDVDLSDLGFVEDSNDETHNGRVHSRDESPVLQHLQGEASIGRETLNAVGVGTTGGRLSPDSFDAS